MDHDEARRLELRKQSAVCRSSTEMKGAYDNGQGLHDEAKEVESPLAATCQRDAGGDHEHNQGKALVGVGYAECP